MMMKLAVLMIMLLCAWATPAWSQVPAAQSATASDSSTTAQFERELLREESGANRAGIDVADGANLVTKLVQIIIATVITCLLAYLILGKFLPKILQMTPGGQRGLNAAASPGLITIIDRLPIDARRSVCVVKVKDEHFLVGMTEQSMTMLSKLDLSEIQAEQLASKTQEVSGLSRFTGLLKKHSEKRTSA
jgi:flagellar biogenesis protein FliO